MPAVWDSLRVWRLTLSLLPLFPLMGFWIGGAPLEFFSAQWSTLLAWSFLFVAAGIANLHFLVSTLLDRPPVPVSLFVLVISGLVNLWAGFAQIQPPLLIYGASLLLAGMVGLLPSDPAPVPIGRKRR